jgi:hypothetical protein
MMPRGGKTPDAQGRRSLPEKGKEEERMEPNKKADDIDADAIIDFDGLEPEAVEPMTEADHQALELVAHYVGYQLDQAAIRGQEVARLKEAGYFKKAASLKKAWRGAISTGDGAKVIALLRERKALQEERRKTVAPLAPARQEIREGLALVTKVGFPEVLRQAGVEPIRHL